MAIFGGGIILPTTAGIFQSLWDIYIVTTFSQVDPRISLEVTVHHGTAVVHQLDLQFPFIEHSLKTYLKRKIFTLALSPQVWW